MSEEQFLKIGFCESLEYGTSNRNIRVVDDARIIYSKILGCFREGVIEVRNMYLGVNISWRSLN